MIELHNTTSQPINIGGWFLSDSSTNLTKYQIAANTTIAAGGYLVLTDRKTTASARAIRASTRRSPCPARRRLYLTSNCRRRCRRIPRARQHRRPPVGVSQALYRNRPARPTSRCSQTPTFGAAPTYAGAANSVPLRGAGRTQRAHVPSRRLPRRRSKPPASRTRTISSSSNCTTAPALPRRSATSTSPTASASPSAGSPTARAASRTLESGATATWSTGALTPGTFTVYANFSLTDPNNNNENRRRGRPVHVTYPGGSLTVPTIDQNTATGGRLFLGTITVTATGTVQVQLTRGRATRTIGRWPARSSSSRRAKTSRSAAPC